MLQALRDKTSGWVAIVVIGLLSIPVAFFGIESYFEIRTPTYVAKVGDKEISQEEFRRRFGEYRERMRQQMGEAFNPAMFDQPTFRREFLDRLIDEEVLVQAAERTGAAATAAALRAEIDKIDAFKVDGKFDARQYQLLLNAQNMTVERFEQELRRDLSARKLPGEVGATALVTDEQVDRYLALRDETRDFRYAIVPPTDPAPEEPTAEAIQAYYDQNADRYAAPEQVSISYVEIDAAKIDVPAEPDEATLRARYEEQRARFESPEQRLVSHILVAVGSDADADAQKAAQEKAAAIATEIQGGADFAAIARERSDDVGSRATGGDLGWVEKNGVLQPAFESALFGMGAGEVSQPVKTDEGYHVIQLREIKPAVTRTLDEVRAELVEQYRTGERDRLYTELSARVIDRIYEDPTALQAAAEAAGLPVQQAGPFPREGGTGVAADPRVVEAAFSDTVLVDGAVSEPIEIGPNHIVLVKLDQHKPRANRPLEEVRAEVIASVQREAAAKATTERATQLEQRFVGGESLEAIAAEVGATVNEALATGRNAFNHDAAVVAEAFRMAPPSADKPSRARVALPVGGYALVELTAITPADPTKADAAAREAARQTLSQGQSFTESRALVEALRAAIEIRVVEERLAI
jgi:peptidyl-prolyl cis-trans isomerase D